MARRQEQSRKECQRHCRLLRQERGWTAPNITLHLRGPHRLASPTRRAVPKPSTSGRLTAAEPPQPCVAANGGRSPGTRVAKAACARDGVGAATSATQLGRSECPKGSKRGSRVRASYRPRSLDILRAGGGADTCSEPPVRRRCRPGAPTAHWAALACTSRGVATRRLRWARDWPASRPAGPQLPPSMQSLRCRWPRRRAWPPNAVGRGRQR